MLSILMSSRLKHKVMWQIYLILTINTQIIVLFYCINMILYTIWPYYQ